MNNWQYNIMKALENSNFDLNSLNYCIEIDKSGKKFMEYIATQKYIYEYLNGLNLINTGFCPITNNKFDDNRHKYSSNGRSIYLSKEGAEICENIKRSELKERGIDYNQYKKLKTKSKLKSIFLMSAYITGSLAITYFIVKPNSFWSIILFILFGLF